VSGKPEDATVSTLMFRPMLLMLEHAGIDPVAFAAATGLPLDVMTDRDARLPRELAVRAWNAACEATGDDAFGLHVGQREPPGVYGSLEYAIRSNATAGEALDQLVRYYRIVSSTAALAVERHEDEMRIVHRAGTSPAVIDNVFALIVRVGRELTGAPFDPREVRLTRAPPREPAEYRAFFRAPVLFGSSEDALVFDAKAGDLPLVTADAELHAALAQRTEAILAELPGDRFVQRARIAVVRSLRAGTGASLDALAALLGTSERTIQRRLREGGTTHTALVDSVRHELAVRWMADGLGTPEIACLLGFSDATVFHRAFKRWTGSTIAQERARVRK
jgi:AraC-like DNA-binding protein